MPAMATTTKVDKFSASNRKECERYVNKMQRQIHKAVEAGNWRKARYCLYLLTRRSRATKILATYKITTKNQGRHTAGTDDMCIPKGIKPSENNRIRLEILKHVKTLRKPKPIRRVYILKSNGKKRPLGIPVILDRIAQEIIRMAIEPILEFHFYDCSYGFRPKRSCHDAIMGVHNKLKGNAPKSPVWIVEGDIRGCFDNIKHSSILDKLRKWHISETITKAIARILKSKISEGQALYPSEKGTPQGGVISPLLANVALTELDEVCRDWTTKKDYTPLVRYADDFIIVCQTKEEAIWWKDALSKRLQEKVGLELSEEKTKITHISEGFDFLGFNVRKYHLQSPYKNPKLLIKPTRENVKGFLKKTRDTIKAMKQATTENLIKTLNPKIQGWGLYYRHVVSKQIFTKIDSEIYQTLWRWAVRRHPKKGKKWIKNRYFKTFRNDRWTLTGEKGTRLMKMASLPIKRYVKIRKGMKIYASDKKTVEYWQNREYKNALNQIYSVKVAKLYKKQKGICPYCNQTMTDISSTHAHHMLPTKYGGTKQLNNLRLMHCTCHRALHSQYPLKQMRDIIKSGHSYL